MPAIVRPRWSLRAPTASAIEVFRAEQERGGVFSYPEQGRTREEEARPTGYNFDLNRARIGTGQADFAAGCRALEAWRMFPEPWTRIVSPEENVRPGQTVAMLAQAFGLWWLNACRIVYVLDEHAPVRRWGFAYGTLDAHVEQGEERFSVELHDDGAVWYDLRAFSRPRYWPVRLAKPLARRLQRRFVRESLASMRRIVELARA